MKANKDDPETLALSTEDAARRANDYRDKPDPFSEDVPPSLLSAEHIRQYIETTGLIAPFYLGGGRKARLKKASYEGRIGKKAYVFDEKNELAPVLIPDKPLVVPANSIVFVESDLDFRLPRYIGLRFNLQIRHVHRGLLLGTGPLVDPGYWGKLCIPLHNLTNEDYEIPLTEGLIWVEFTKTTSDSSEGRITLEEGEEHREHWAIEDFLRKAATPLVEGKPAVGIRSSIPMMVADATDKAQQAQTSSLEALRASETAAKNAATAEEHALRTRDLFNRIGWLGALVAAVAVVALWATFFFGVRSDINGIQSNLIQLNSKLADLTSANGAESERFNALRTRYDELLQRLVTSEATVEVLRNEIEMFNRQRGLDTSDDSAPVIPDAE